MHSKRKNDEPDYPPRERPEEPKHYSCPEGLAHLDVMGKRTRIHILLDSGATCFLMSERLVERLDIAFAVRRKPIKIVGFDGLSSATGGQRYTYQNTLEIGNNHRSPITT